MSLGAEENNMGYVDNYFDGKVAVVLGCSGEGGIGYVAAETLAKRGAKVVVAARSFDKVQALADRIGGHAVACDAGKEDEVKALAQAALDQHGRVDFAINSAGMPIPGMVSDISAESLLRVTEVNYFANVYFIREMAKAIKRDGSIIILSALSATDYWEGIFGYACAKAAVDCLVRYAAHEYGKHNIRVNSILPGAIHSFMSKPLFDAPGAAETQAKEIPLGRIGKPEEAAECILWLCRESYVTGLNVPVAGGQQLTRYPYIHEYPTGKEAFAGAVDAASSARDGNG